MNDRINKTSICSIVFIDIIGYSKKTDSEQIEVKTQFNALINNALKDIAQNDRIILDTGDGAAIACNGSPEDALFISLTIRDEILKNNIIMPTPLYVRIGINLGPVRVVSDINGQPNIIGDGINVAQRIMSFSQPNQILVSRSYYEVTSRLTQEISQLFDYSGIKHDKHVREHEIYSVRSLKNQVYAEAPIVADDDMAQAHMSNKMNQNWKYALLALPAIVAFGLLIQKASLPTTPTLIIPNESTAAVPTSNTLLPNETVEKAPMVAANPLTLEKSLEKTPEKTAEKTTKNTTEKTLNITAENSQDAKVAMQEIAPAVAPKITKKAKAEPSEVLPQESVPPPHKTVTETPHAEATPAAKTVKVAEQKTEQSHQKSTWNSVKDSVSNGRKKNCTQVEIAMNQCLTP